MRRNLRVWCWYLAIGLLTVAACFLPMKPLVRGYIGAALSYLPAMILTRCFLPGSGMQETVLGISLRKWSGWTAALGLVLCGACLFRENAALAYFGPALLLVAGELFLLWREARVGPHRKTTS